MKVTAFPAGKGDCLLVTSADGRNLLVDAGEATAYREHVRPALNALGRQGTPIDVVCVSHIDDDHIGGVLQLMDDLVAWAVHDFQVESGNTRHRPPGFDRPPEVKAVWHNGFSDQLGENSGDVETMLSQAAAVLAGSTEPARLGEGQRNAAIAQGVQKAVALSRRLDGGQLGIPINPEFGGKMMLAGRADGKLKLGTTRVSVLGPRTRDLTKLRAKWNAWLRDNREALEEARARAVADERRLGNELVRLVRPLELQAKVFGKRSEVSAPNLASIMLLLEEDGRTALLTGDGHGDDVVEGLKSLDRLDADGRCHVDLLKVQHHGSEHNSDLGFFEHVTADQYLFCADGSHANPDAGIVDLLLKARLRSPSDGGFTLLFTNSSATTDGDRRKQMREVERVVDRWQALHPRAFKARFRGLAGAPKARITISL